MKYLKLILTSLLLFSFLTSQSFGFLKKLNDGLNKISEELDSIGNLPAGKATKEAEKSNELTENKSPGVVEGFYYDQPNKTLDMLTRGGIDLEKFVVVFGYETQPWGEYVESIACMNTVIIDDGAAFRTNIDKSYPWTVLPDKVDSWSVIELEKNDILKQFWHKNKHQIDVKELREKLVLYCSILSELNSAKREKLNLKHEEEKLFKNINLHESYSSLLGKVKNDAFYKNVKEKAHGDNKSIVADALIGKYPVTIKFMVVGDKLVGLSLGYLFENLIDIQKHYLSTGLLNHPHRSGNSVKSIADYIKFKTADERLNYLQGLSNSYKPGFINEALYNELTKFFKEKVFAKYASGYNSERTIQFGEDIEGFFELDSSDPDFLDFISSERITLGGLKLGGSDEKGELPRYHISYDLFSRLFILENGIPTLESDLKQIGTEINMLIQVNSGVDELF